MDNRNNNPFFASDSRLSNDVSAVRASIRRLPSVFEQLLYVADAHDSKGQYADPLLAFDHDAAELDAEFRKQHRRIFAAWLALKLEEQHSQVLTFFQGQQQPTIVLAHWKRGRRYERLVPADGLPLEAELFLSDFEIVVELVDRDLRQAIGSRVSDTSREGTPIASAILHHLCGSELKTFVCRILTKEHVADLWERGKVRAAQYAEQLNRLRSDASLPAIHPMALRRRGTQH